MADADYLIRDGLIVTQNPTRAIFRGGIAIHGNRIVGVGRTDELLHQYKAAQTVDARGKVIMPGMVNGHNHLWGAITKGLKVTEGLKLDELLRTLWWLQEDMTADDFYALSLLGCIENLRAGITTIVNHVYPIHRAGIDDASIRAFLDARVRGVFARGIMTQGYPPICESPDKALQGAVELAERYRSQGIHVVIAPVSFRQAAPEDYTRARELANQHHLRLYTHVAETPQEVEMIQAQHGARPVEFLHRLGFTGRDVALVHCVLLSEREVALLAETGTSVVHCPSNNMKLAKGVTPVPALLRAGIAVGLATDSPEVRQDMLMEMNQEVLMQSLHQGNPAALTPQQALDMATLHGARAVGLEGEIGSIEPGKRADLVVLDFRKPHLAPLFNVVYNLVHFARAEDVETVFVDGVPAVHERRYLPVDEHDAIARAEAAARDYVARVKRTDLIARYD
jgi:5-methylthioadenosine/S-adenosylhomocysteine deaminase